ncbi:MAG: glycosyltransferase family 39 protein [Rudaea sp.]|uniref:glycosyltransferase family 39 protein n=1 Tax=unclassified Rudaea TaxID=2627037 RepID=UPI0010F5EFF3|nr:MULTISPECIES: glycosyltransferase family 39 protein [unclassified Rudaea]MBN8887532.1 glycosyltransferase family 39 protein [Rudaea sp.]
MKKAANGDLILLLALAAAKLVFHIATNGQYGFHRDELQFLSDARHLDWGYVAYPPLTPFLGRIQWELFGASLTGFRFFPALAQSIVFVVVGLMARRLGGGRIAMLVAAFATALAPVSLSGSTLFMYVTFDYLWYVLLAYFVVCRIESGDARWWLAIGAMVGLGMMTKYTAALFAVGLVAGVVFTPLRADLRSKWLWYGVGLSLLIFLPNLIWQFRHDFVTLDMLQRIHARDVRIGRADGFWIQQINNVSTNLFTLPIWVAGLAYAAFGARGRYRILVWMFAVPIALFALAQGRGYYTGPLYPMLFAAGAVALQCWLAGRTPLVRRAAWSAAGLLLLAGTVVVPVVLPLVPVESSHWQRLNTLNGGDFREQFGWPELAREVARIRAGLTDEERAQTGIWASNYGEAGALDLYGAQFGLPQVWSAANSFWLRGPYGPTPQNMIVVGADRKDLDQPCTTVELIGHTGNEAKVENEETKWHPNIFLCRGVRKPLVELWPTLAEFM